jgi:hypothetical protein
MARYPSSSFIYGCRADSYIQVFEIELHITGRTRGHKAILHRQILIIHFQIRLREWNLDGHLINVVFSEPKISALNTYLLTMYEGQPLSTSVVNPMFVDYNRINKLPAYLLQLPAHFNVELNE